MGIFADALAIVCGSLFGSRTRKGIRGDNYAILGIGIMIVSLVGFLENIYSVQGTSMVSEDLMVVLFSYLLGSKLGYALRLEDRLSSVGKSHDANRNALVDAALFFGVGGMQICGPVALAISGDNSQLLIKSAIDFSFALAFGATYGKIAALSALPVAAGQVLIALIAFLFRTLFHDALIMQLCAMGYIILFFSGFNLMTNGKYKVSNINMLPGIVLIILFQLAGSIWRCLS